MNIFVAKLNPSTTTRDLQNLFSHYGLVSSVKIILDHATDRSRGYGFVEMPNNYEAHEALKELDNTIFQESVITVKNSQPNSNRISWEEEGNSISVGHPVRSGVQPGYKRNPAPVVKPQQDNSSRRNFGYRGGGYRSF